MNHTLDQFTDNPIIDKLVSWPPRSQSISSLRASTPIFRQPFIEITLDNNETITRSFSNGGFTEYWTEAKIILETLTPIDLISDVKVSETIDADELIAWVLKEREDSVIEAGFMFDNGVYQQYLWQFGSDYKGLPEQVMKNIAVAKAHIKGE